VFLQKNQANVIGIDRVRHDYMVTKVVVEVNNQSPKARADRGFSRGAEIDKRRLLGSSGEGKSGDENGHRHCCFDSPDSDSEVVLERSELGLGYRTAAILTTE
jgi:hypothetical protein